MCGRFYLDADPATVAEHFDLAVAPSLSPRYNIAPSQDVAIVRRGQQANELAMVRWGLIPSWAREEKTRYSMINARAETVGEKPAYREAFHRRRCLVPVSGFYEWQTGAEGKQPWCIAAADGGLLGLAGLWERWQGAGDPVESCTIVVTGANDTVSPIHDRMPVILEPRDYARWLDPENHDAASLAKLLRPASVDRLATWPVSRHVNNPVNDDPGCIARLG